MSLIKFGNIYIDNTNISYIDINDKDGELQICMKEGTNLGLSKKHHSEEYEEVKGFLDVMERAGAILSAKKLIEESEKVFKIGNIVKEEIDRVNLDQNLTREEKMARVKQMIAEKSLKLNDDEGKEN